MTKARRSLGGGGGGAEGALSQGGTGREKERETFGERAQCAPLLVWSYLSSNQPQGERERVRERGGEKSPTLLGQSSKLEMIFILQDGKLASTPS